MQADVIQAREVPLPMIVLHSDSEAFICDVLRRLLNGKSLCVWQDWIRIWAAPGDVVLRLHQEVLLAVWMYPLLTFSQASQTCEEVVRGQLDAYARARIQSDVSR